MGRLLKFPGAEAPGAEPKRRRKKKTNAPAVPKPTGKKNIAGSSPKEVALDRIERRIEDPIERRERALRLLRSMKPMSVGMGCLFGETRTAIEEAGRLTMDDGENSARAMERLRETVAAADRFKTSAISRYLDNDITKEQLEIEMTRAQVVTYLASAIEKLVDASFASKPGIYVLSSVLAEQLSAIVENSFLPATKTSYHFSSQENQEIEKITSAYNYFSSLIKPYADELKVQFGDIKTVIENARTLMAFAVSMVPRKDES